MVQTAGSRYSTTPLGREEKFGGQSQVKDGAVVRAMEVIFKFSGRGAGLQFKLKERQGTFDLMDHACAAFCTEVPEFYAFR